jgi:dTDP-4-dehydrorhamnose 3,5-epimerase-like enzyme
MPHEIVEPGFVRRDERGTFLEIVNGFESRTAVCGRMRAGAVLGNHYHRRTRVFFYLTRGRARVRAVHVETGEKDEFTLEEDQGVVFETNESHAVRFLGDGEFVMLKSLPYDPADPDTYPYSVEDDPRP